MGQVSGTHWTALARLTREFHPLRVSQVALFACDGSRPMEAASTLGLRLGNLVSPRYADHRLQARHGLSVRGRLLSLYLPSQSGVVACSFPHGFPLGRISDVSSGPIQLPDCRQPAQKRPYGCACADRRRCRKSPHFEGCFREIVFSNKWILCSLCLFWGEKAGGSCQNTACSRRS